MCHCVACMWEKQISKKLISNFLQICFARMHTEQTIISILTHVSAPNIALSSSVEQSAVSTSASFSCACEHIEFAENWTSIFWHKTRIQFFQSSHQPHAQNTPSRQKFAQCIALNQRFLHVSFALSCSIASKSPRFNLCSLVSILWKLSHQSFLKILLFFLTFFYFFLH